MTIDEAVAILMGWTTGPILYSSSKHDLTDEECDLLQSETFSLADELEQRESDCEGELADAQDSGAPREVIEQKRAVLEQNRGQAQEAIAYLCAVKDEINKGGQSALRVDSSLTDSLDTFITLTSLNEWSVERYGKPVSGAMVEKGPKALEADLEPPKVRRKLRDQEDAILSQLEALGYTPKSLPRNESGKNGPKFEVKQALAISPLFKGTKTSFDKAWERLRKDGSITDPT